LLCRDLVALDI